MWEGNKSLAGSLESIILNGAKQILGCSSETCNEAVRGDMGLDTLQSCRDRAKLKWWYKLATLPEDRYPKQLFNSLETIVDISAHLFPTFRVRSGYICAIAIYLKFHAKCRRSSLGSSLSFAYNRRSYIRHAPTGVCGMCGSFPTCNGARADTSGRLDTGLFTIPGKRLRCVTAKQL